MGNRVTSRSVIAVVLIAIVSLAACSEPGSDVRPDADGAATITVPGNASTIQEAVDAAKPGDTIEVSPGTYEESVAIKTENITLRGTDRNAVILDGGGLKSNGVVVTAGKVTVENLTVRNYNLNGVLVTGFSDEGGGLARGSDGYRRLDPEKFPPLDGFAVRYVTASNNGLYGIYAFDSHNGVIENSYASGHADSGYYVGQCEGCNIVVRDNVAELNAVGYEQANASTTVSVVRNRFSSNRIGLTLLSDYQEAFVPQRGGVVAGNLIADNAADKTPAQADGGFGVGIGVSGGQDNKINNNLVTGHPSAGFVITSSEDIAPVGNQLTDNTTTGNAVDIAYTATDRAPGDGNCLQGNKTTSTLPANLGKQWACPDGGSKAVGTELPTIKVPDGISFRQVLAPPPQPQQPADRAGNKPEAPPVTDEDLSTPAADLFADRAHS